MVGIGWCWWLILFDPAALDANVNVDGKDGANNGSAYGSDIHLPLLFRRQLAMRFRLGI